MLYQQGYLFINRDDIINEYQPILIEKAANFSKAAATIHTEGKIVEEVLKNDTLTAIALMNTQIANIKKTIVDAKNASANKTSVLNCLSIQEKAAAGLTAAGINTTCWVPVDFSDLRARETDFDTLAKIPNNTLSACGTLDPLPSQDDLFLDCITNKILDLDSQLGIVNQNFINSKNSIVTSTVECITSQTGLIAEKINEINFQVTLCLSLGIL